MKILGASLILLVAAAVTQAAVLDNLPVETRVKRNINQNTNLNELVRNLTKALDTTVDGLMDSVQNLLKQACSSGQSLTSSLRAMVSVSNAVGGLANTLGTVTNGLAGTASGVVNSASGSGGGGFLGLGPSLSSGNDSKTSSSLFGRRRRSPVLQATNTLVSGVTKTVGQTAQGIAETLLKTTNELTAGVPGLSAFNLGRKRRDVEVTAESGPSADRKRREVAQAATSPDGGQVELTGQAVQNVAPIAAPIIPNGSTGGLSGPGLHGRRKRNVGVETGLISNRKRREVVQAAQGLGGGLVKTAGQAVQNVVPTATGTVSALTGELPGADLFGRRKRDVSVEAVFKADRKRREVVQAATSPDGVQVELTGQAVQNAAPIAVVFPGRFTRSLSRPGFNARRKRNVGVEAGFISGRKSREVVQAAPDLVKTAGQAVQNVAPTVTGTANALTGGLPGYQENWKNKLFSK